MGRKPKRDGYLVRQALNSIDRSGTMINRALERLLEVDGAQARAMLIAEAALANHRISDAVKMLSGILLEDDHE